MLGALKSLFKSRPDEGQNAPPPVVETIDAAFEDVAGSTDGAVALRRTYELPPDTAQILRQFGMPDNIARAVFQAEPVYDFAIRPIEKPRVSVRRFLLFARAMDWKGEFRHDEVWEMYEQFCIYDHRELNREQNLVLNALAGAPGVWKKRVLLPGKKRDSRWTYIIKPRPFTKALGSAMPAKTPTTELPDNVVSLVATRQAAARDRRRFGRRRHRQRRAA